MKTKIAVKIMKKNFHNFNFPTQKDGSFVVKLENRLADAWDVCLQTIYGEPKVNNNAKTGVEISRLWKISYEECELTVHFYKKPKTTKTSKFLVQGRNHGAKYLFVFTELPIIYKRVCEMVPQKVLPVPKTMKPISGVICEKCKFSSSSMMQMKKHIMTIHNPNRSTRSKRIANFTPISKPSKLEKKSTPSRPNVFLNSEGILDESLLMLDNTFGGKVPEITIEENTEIREVIL